ncbi:MAG: 16S rRNA (cytosine(1402)-N(4))-methyltransferase RsmH [Bacteroidales bacterium]|nr:16S rRNA (cytosine(1402)-N(4))-methyltransferase RsmH [Bacteroidales bacterium]MBD5377371.1 16S rRNA (cytosine(1402)-N(4))-methyltransferase RsmH [Bacteroides sp.]
MPEVYHIPALLPETLEALNLRPDGVYVDATLGGGGHSRAIVERLGSEGHLYSFDQDEDAIKRAFKDPRFTAVWGNFRFLSNFLRWYGVDGVDGILADLGVSFHHFDDAERGFSFRWEGPLDMRMNRQGKLTAADIVNTYTEERLAELLRLYGEVKDARRMASAIVKARAQEPVDTVERLLAIISPMISPKREKKELAQVFQALRIEVNDELGALRSFLEQCLRALRPGGRLAIITYHSLEDRLVKNFMKAGNFSGTVEQDFFGRRLSPMRMLGSRPIVPTDEEIERNPRSRSAKLRVAEKTEPGK